MFQCISDTWFSSGVLNILCNKTPLKSKYNLTLANTLINYLIPVKYAFIFKILSNNFKNCKHLKVTRKLFSGLIKKRLIIYLPSQIYLSNILLFYLLKCIRCCVKTSCFPFKVFYFVAQKRAINLENTGNFRRNKVRKTS